MIDPNNLFSAPLRHNRGTIASPVSVPDKTGEMVQWNTGQYRKATCGGTHTHTHSPHQHKLAHRHTHVHTQTHTASVGASSSREFRLRRPLARGTLRHDMRKLSKMFHARSSKHESDMHVMLHSQRQAMNNYPKPMKPQHAAYPPEHKHNPQISA